MKTVLKMGWIKKKEAQVKGLEIVINKIIRYIFPSFNLRGVKAENEKQFILMIENFLKVKNVTNAQKKELFTALEKATENIIRDGGEKYSREAWNRYLNSQSNRIGNEIYNLALENRKELIQTIKKELFNTEGGTWQEKYANFSKKIKDIEKSKKYIIERIARTESHKTFNELQLKTFEAGQINQIRWVALSGARPTHAEANGQTITLGDYFTVGTDKMKAPGLGSEAKENINCRCYIRPVGKLKEIKNII